MSKYINIAIICLISLVGCKEKSTKSEGTFKYEYNKLINAWESNDSLYLKEWIYNLKSLDFISFVNRVSEFANETNFGYGNIDVEGEINSRWSENEKVILRNNITNVYLVYIESCVFLNKAISNDSTDAISNKYWNDSTVFLKDDIKNIRIDLDAFCLHKD